MKRDHPEYLAEMFILFRAIVYATLFVAFGLVFLPSWLGHEWFPKAAVEWLARHRRQ